MFPLNQQVREKPDHLNADRLSAVKIWHTIQGEGPYAGTPAVFLRLAGCNLQCPACDTDYTSGRMTHTTDELRNYIVNVLNFHTKTNLVVITGGEPFRQAIGPLVRKLCEDGFKVQIETNGTIFLEDFPYIPTTVVCSPKTPHLAGGLVDKITAWKYILEAGCIAEWDGLPITTLGANCSVARPPEWVKRSTIYVQPLDVQDPDRNKANLEATAASSLKFGYRLCLQMHKLANLE